MDTYFKLKTFFKKKKSLKKERVLKGHNGKKMFQERNSFCKKEKKYCVLSVQLIMFLQTWCWKWENEIVTHKMFRNVMLLWGNGNIVLLLSYSHSL